MPSNPLATAMSMIAATLVASSAAAQTDDRGCGGEVACPLSVEGQPERQYYAALPADIDDRAAVPVMIWYHGFRGSGLAGIRNRALVQGWTDAGYIFVAADGLDGRWTHQGNPRTEPDDDAYSVAIVEDLAADYPVDPQRVVAAGFSSGGFMVWSLACFQGAPFTHFAPVSGAFWEPLPEACEAGPVIMRHTHGTADTVVPLEGRWLRDTFKQGDVFESFDVMIANNACVATPDLTDLDVPPSSCSVWQSCASDTSLQLCLHDGGHGLPAGWSASTQAWIDATADGEVATTH
ncbi:MAG: prolyl oligopeptidase family serine peptidase [Pseudomonadota bacterium]